MKTLITLGFILVSLLVLSCVYVEKCAPYVIKDDNTEKEVEND